jgi:cellulase/cellobiase CelA1
MARLGRSQPFPPVLKRFPLGAASCAVTGTVTTATEVDIVAGGRTIILTLTGDTWVTAGGTFDAQRQNIINGIDSAQSETLGWDLVVKALQGVAGVVRTSDTVVTITLDAFATYDITATETITATAPATAVNLGAAIVGSPTFNVTATGAAGQPFLARFAHIPFVPSLGRSING